MMECLNFQIQGKSRICSIWLYPKNNLHLNNLKLEPFDIIVCDGPYGILKPECEWDDFDLNTKNGRARFRQYYRNLFDACLKHLKKSGSIFIFNYPEGASIVKSVLDDEYPVHFRRWITWVYDNHFDFDRGTNFRRSHETILYYTKQVDGFIFHGDNVSDVLSHPIIKIESSSFKHGAKPLEIMRCLINTAYCSGGRLLSLFAGTGADIVAALEHDMDVVGFEFKTSNFDMLAKNICDSSNFVSARPFGKSCP